MARAGNKIPGTNLPHGGEERGKEQRKEKNTRIPKAEIQQRNHDVSNISNPT